MKKLAILLSSLFSKELCAALKLQQQQYLLLIPKSIFEKYGIWDENISFDLVISENKITLLGPEITNPRVRQSTAKEIVI